MHKFKVGDRVVRMYTPDDEGIADVEQFIKPGEVRIVTRVSSGDGWIHFDDCVYGFDPESFDWVIPEMTSESEVRVTDPTTGGQKGQKQAQLGALDPRALMEVAKVAGFGGEKYARYNFAKGYKWSLSYDALQRHLAAFWDGTDKDDESSLYHLAHAAWHCLTLLTFSLRGLGTDDRFPQGDKNV